MVADHSVVAGAAGIDLAGRPRGGQAVPRRYPDVRGGTDLGVARAGAAQLELMAEPSSLREGSQ